MMQHSITLYTNMQEYLVTLYNIEDSEDFYNDMETPGGTLYIPNRAVDLVARRSISRTTHYLLTAEEADLLKQDPRVMDVRLNDEDLGIKILPLGGFDANLRQTSSAWDTSNTVSAEMLNWGLVRCTRPRSNVTLQWDVWGYLADRALYANAEIGFRYFAIDNRNYYTKNATGDSWTDEGDWDTSYASWGNYFNTGVWPTATTATVDLNFYGANVDVVIVDGGNIPVDHPEFAVNPDGTGGSRCVQYNWYQHNPVVKGTAVGNYAYGVSYSSHATHVTGTVAGITQGWAKRANIYNISFNEGAYVIDYIREFHKSKPINPATGVKNPTIVNNSWGKFHGKFTKDKITSVRYRGNVYSSPFTDKQLFDYGLLQSAFTDNIGNFEDTALDQDLIDANSEGIIFVGAAGNSKFLIDRQDGPDWNNYAVISANLLHEGHVSANTYYYNRGQVPGNYSSFYKLCVGMLGDFPWDSKAALSNCGPGVDLYAPGYNIMSAYLNEVNINPAVPDSRNGSYYLQKNQGTSMASPQIAGIIACLAERYPHWTQKEFKDYLFQYAEYGTIKDGARGWRANSVVATSNYNIQGSGNRVAKLAPRGLRYEGNLSITEISNEFLDANVTNKSLSDYFGGDSGIYGPFSGGDSMYTSPGNYTWLCPANVYSVSVVLVGGGGSGGTGVSGDANVAGAGGGGGALGWVNNISVTPGQSYSVRVGAGGAALTAIGQYGNNGQDSYIIIDSTTYTAGQGSGGPGGTWLVGQPEGGPGGISTNCQGGGAGGAGGFGTISTKRAGGGGGAGGYTGNGGGGGYYTTTEIYAGGSGAGGAGGGGTYSAVSGIATRGGSVGIFGELGDGALNSNGSVFAAQTNVGAGGAGGASTSGAGMGGAVRIMWPGAHRSFPVTQVDNRTTIYPPRKFSDYYSADYKLTKIVTANLTNGFNWSANTTNYTTFPTSHRLATNTKKIVVLPNVTISSTTTPGNTFLVSGNWEGDVIIENRGTIIAAGGDPSETLSIRSGGHGIGISKANATSNAKIINYGFIAGGGAAGGTGGQGGEGEWEYLTYSNTYSGTANIVRWRGYRKDNGVDYPGYDVWAWNAAYTKTTGTLTRYTPTAGSLEVQQAQNSGYWYSSYSLAQDHWYYDSLEPNLRIRIAAIDAGGNSRYRPYYAGQVLYYHYVGPPNTRLGVTMTKATITSLGFAGTRYNLTAFDRPYLTTSARSHIAVTWGTNSTVNTTTPSEDGKIFTVTVSSGTGIGTDADPYKDFHYTRVSTTSAWRTTGYSHRPGTAQWPKNMWTGGVASNAGGQDPRDGVSETFYANILNGSAAVRTRYIDSSNTSSLCIYNVPATVSYPGISLDLFYYPTYNIYGGLGHPWYYLYYNDTNGYDGGVLFTYSSGGLTYGGGFSSGLTTNVIISSVTTNYRKTARRAGGAGGFGRGYSQGITYGSSGAAAFENAGEGGYGGPGGDYGEDGLVGNIGFYGTIANSNVVGANIIPLEGNVGGIGGNVIYGDYVYLVNYGNVYGRYNDGKYNDGLENPSGDGNNRPRYRPGI